MRTLAALLLAGLLAGCLDPTDPVTSQGGVQEDPRASGSEQESLEDQGTGAGAGPGAGDPPSSDPASDPDPDPATGPGEEAPSSAMDPTAASAPQGSQAGSAASHGDPRRVDGQVTVAVEGNGFVARRTVTIDNDFGGAARSDVLLRTFNGAIGADPADDGGYHFVAFLWGRGTTEQEAREALDALNLEADDSLAQGRLDLSFVVSSGEPAEVPVLGPLQAQQNGATLHLALPPEPAHDLEAGTVNGDVQATGLHGPRLKAGTTNGDVEVSGAFDRVEAGSTNGRIDLQGTANDIQATTSNGRIVTSVHSTRTALATLTTSNGRVEVQLPRDASAYDIDASTTNGGITIAAEGQEREEDGHATFRSADWSSAAVRVTLDLTTTNGSIVITD